MTTATLPSPQRQERRVPLSNHAWNAACHLGYFCCLSLLLDCPVLTVWQISSLFLLLFVSVLFLPLTFFSSPSLSHPPFCLEFVAWSFPGTAFLVIVLTRCSSFLQLCCSLWEGAREKR